jgi:hypothetical protein
MSDGTAARPRPSRRRVLAFGTVVVVLLASIAAYLLLQRQQDSQAASDAAATEAGTTRLAVDEVTDRPHLVVRNTQAGTAYGKVALVPLEDPSGPRAIVDLDCVRVSATAGGAICLQEVPGLVVTYRAVLLDEEWREVGTQELGGIPSRARVSSDGSWAASTVFVAGHSYTDAQFSTETVVTDLTTRTALGNLETWTTLREGAPFAPADRNYWGVSFVGDGPRFFATMGTDGRRLLVEGDAGTRTLTVVGVEGACPSVSPDGSGVVYKEQDPESRNDHFVARDLATGATVPLDEGRLVDDQVAWLDDESVLYAVGKGVAASADFDVWSAPVGGGAPAVLVPDAASPSLVVPRA